MKNNLVKKSSNQITKDMVLKLIVSHFIKTAEPVASKTLVEKYKLGFSSASVRSIMNILEKEKFLEKVHVSSGRVPSKKGYEYYLSKISKKNISEEIKTRLQLIFDKKISSVESIIRDSCKILSDITNLVSVSSSLKSINEYLTEIRFIPISNNSATAILITDKGFVENKTFVFKNDVKIKDIVSCIKIFNDRLKGTRIDELVSKMEAIKPILSNYIIHDVIYNVLLDFFVKFTKEHLELYGKESFFNYPEFMNDNEKLKKIFNLFNNQNELKKEIKKANNKICNNVNGYIDEYNNISVITSRISLGNRNEDISLLGPPRMDYDKAVNLLSYVANAINEHFKFLGGDKKNNGNRKNERKKSK